jgi:predicted metal-dependent hydrolase
MTVAPVELSALWGGETLQFSVFRAPRTTLRITIAPDGAISVHAPEKATDAEVVARVARRGAWITRQLRQFNQWRPRTPARQYISGETHLYLGRQYRLLVADSEVPDVRIDGDRLVLAIRSGSSFTYRRTVLQHWYNLQSHRILPDRFDAIAPPFLRLGIAKPRLIIRAMVRRWGSYTPAGNLVLNRELVRASPHLIDYVIAHELAHALYPDHGEDWRNLLTRTMPDWRGRKAELEQQLL